MQNGQGSLSGIQSGDTLKKRFVVFNCLGKGGFGAVYEVYDWQRNEECALKMEFVKQDKESSLKIEVSALKRLQHSKYFPRFIESGQYHKCNFIVMQLVGQNLRDLCKHCPKSRFSLDTSIRLSFECLKAIESMHASGMLHRDIKPHNFTIGTTPADSQQIYLLDFGLVRRFTTKENTIRRQRTSAGFRVKWPAEQPNHELQYSASYFWERFTSEEKDRRREMKKNEIPVHGRKKQTAFWTFAREFEIYIKQDTFNELYCKKLWHAMDPTAKLTWYSINLMSETDLLHAINNEIQFAIM